MSENNQVENPEGKQASYGAGKKEINISLIHPWRAFAFEVFLFSLSLGLGILTGLRLNEIFKILNVSPEKISAWQFIIYFLFATLFLLSVIYFLKFKKGKEIFFRVIFLSAIVIGNFFFFGLWLSDVPALLITAVLVFLLLKESSLLVHNLALIFAVAGVGAGLGLRLQPEIVVLLLLIFSVYDYIAVYKTKHMIKMAKEMIAQKAILGIVIPQSISGFGAQVKEIEPGGKFLVLGAGDIIFPLILSCSLIPQGILNSLIVALFSLFGLLAGFLFFISQKIRQPMPALPPIAFFSIIGYLITKII